jgi:hypothetical protein
MHADDGSLTISAVPDPGSLVLVMVGIGGAWSAPLRRPIAPSPRITSGTFNLDIYTTGMK